MAGARPRVAPVIARAPFGATGHDSSRVIFGAAAPASVSQAEADGAPRLLLEHGVNHIDVAADYGDAELRIAPRLRRSRRLLRRYQDLGAEVPRRP